MLELGFPMTLLGFVWFSVAFALGMWRGGVLFKVPKIYTFINLGVWVGGGLVFDVGFWLVFIGMALHLVRIL